MDLTNLDVTGDQLRLDEYVFNTEAHALRIHPEYEWGATWGSLPSLAELDAADAANGRRNASASASSRASDEQRAAEASAAAAVGGGADRMRARVEARTALLAQLPTSV